MKSLAHPEWPYAGTAHEWRGFMKDRGFSVPQGFKLAEPDKLSEEMMKPGGIIMIERLKRGERQPIYQTQNFGPELT